MSMQHRYIEVLQQIKREHQNELSEELIEEIDSLLENEQFLPTLEQADKTMAIIVKILKAVESVQDWFP